MKKVIKRKKRKRFSIKNEKGILVASSNEIRQSAAKALQSSFIPVKQRI